jgi:mannose-6-phosphate isomerase-like protein (cupin superfamily)
MFHILHPRDQRKGAIAAVEFEGEPYGAGVSFFQGDLQPGKGPGLHRHPYAETCIVLSGQAAMVVDGEEVVAGAGDIVVIASATPHCFTAIGDERLQMVCIHASDRVMIEPVNDR